MRIRKTKRNAGIGAPRDSILDFGGKSVWSNGRSDVAGGGKHKTSWREGEVSKGEEGCVGKSLNMSLLYTGNEAGREEINKCSGGRRELGEFRAFRGRFLMRVG